MKKLILLFVAIAAFTIQGTAQEISDHAIGIRLSSDTEGVGPEVNYQHRLTDNNRLEFGFGYHGGTWHNNVKLTGLYQWVWEIDNGFNWYAGPGVGMGIENHKYREWYYRDRNKESNFFGFVTGTIGIEYNFDFPLLLSFDFRPQINFGYSDTISYDFGLAARYVF